MSTIPLTGPADAPEVLDEESGSSIQSVEVCARCGATEFLQAETRAAFWDNDRLVVVEDIPTIICAICREQHYADETAVKLDLLRGTGFPPEQAERHVAVPVFSLRSDWN